MNWVLVQVMVFMGKQCGLRRQVSMQCTLMAWPSLGLGHWEFSSPLNLI